MRFFLFLFMALSFLNTNAQEQAQGYYVTLNNDTVYVTYKLKTTPGFFTGADNLYEELPVINRENEKVKFKPSEIKGFFIEWKGDHAYFISMPIRNGKLKFLRALLSTPQLCIYEFSVAYRNGVATQFALHRAEADTLYVGPDDGNQKTKKRLKEFFADREDVLSVMSAKKDLFTRPGLVPYDMGRLIEGILDLYKK